MRLIVLNPNRDEGMTAAMVDALRRRLPADAQVLGWTDADGPPVIRDRASFETAAARVPAWTAAIPAADAILLACFGDPGLPALRECAAVPVVGLAEAAIAEAAGRGEAFAILTAGADWIPILEGCVDAAGASAYSAGVMALGCDGAALRKEPERHRVEILARSREARERGARRLILGGAAFEGLAFEFDAGLAVDRPIDAVVRRLAPSAGDRFERLAPA